MTWPLALLVGGLTTFFSQTSPIPYEPNSDGRGPTISNETVAQSLRGKYSSIHKVDFGNLKPLKNGRYLEHEDGCHYSEELEKVYYPGTPKPNGQAALVLYSWIDAGGSSSQGGIEQVFRIVGATLRSTRKISWDAHFQAGQPFVKFDPSNNRLVIRSAHYIPGDAHGCVSALDVVMFRWDGAAFEQANRQTELSEYESRKANNCLADSGLHVPE